jgi:serine O-acetyltransferase
MDKAFLRNLYMSHQACPTCASPAEVASFFTDLLGVLFADYTPHTFSSEKEFEDHFNKVRLTLTDLLKYNSNKRKNEADQVVENFFNSLPDVYKNINEDVTAMFEGDPAAKSRSEVIRTYPGFYAIAAYRVAHELHRLGVTEVPRVITEHAHSKTGIDIHPAAKIGSHFCIDHGTGIVIGETAQIGNYVKLYQGVTLGALSVSKQDAEKKRHPTIEDQVVVYAGATILGGDTIIGHNSVIGGNVWLTKSTPPNSKIYYQAKMYNSDKDESDIVIFRAEK